MIDIKPFDTNEFFAGGNGMFIQYHDIVKPVYLYSVIKMILTNQTYGVPVDIIKNFSILSIVEWYMNRRYKNPLQCLDFNNCIDGEYLDILLRIILNNDKSIYKYSPLLNINKMMNVYRTHHMSFPVYVYSENEEIHINEECNRLFNGVHVKYLYGDLKDSILKNCDQNFTYIFSDIELVKNSAQILTGSCSHILLANDYRYNYIDNRKTLKYDLTDLAIKHPFVRIGLTNAVDMYSLARSFTNLRKIQQEGAI